MNQSRAKAVKISLYGGSLKYKHSSDPRPPFSIREPVIVASEKNTNNERWEKDVKNTVKFSLETLREKLTPYMRLPLWAILSSRN